jgi:hypothetical protein
MRALTLKQPYASAIAAGIKHYEIRSWRTRYRGQLLIHAGARRVAHRCVDSNMYVRESQFVAACNLHECLEIIKRGRGYALLADGTRVCDRRELELGGFSVGSFAWELRDVSPIESCDRIIGRLSLWRPTEAELARIH